MLDVDRIQPVYHVLLSQRQIVDVSRMRPDVFDDLVAVFRTDLEGTAGTRVLVSVSHTNRHDTMINNNGGNPWDIRLRYVIQWVLGNRYRAPFTRCPFDGRLTDQYGRFYSIRMFGVDAVVTTGSISIS